MAKSIDEYLKYIRELGFRNCEFTKPADISINNSDIKDCVGIINTSIDGMVSSVLIKSNNIYHHYFKDPVSEKWEKIEY